MFPLNDGDLKRQSFPYVNILIILVCAAVFIYELTLTGLDRDLFFYQFGLIPAELIQGLDFTWLSSQGLLTAEQLSGENTAWLERSGYIANIETPVPNWATLFTSMFIHGDWMHFVANMLFLWVFGDNVEDKFGHFRYLLFYLAAGVAASLIQVATDTSSQIPTIGASGAIAGVLGAYLLLFPYSRIGTAVVFFFITYVKIPAIYLLGFWILLQFISGIGTLGPSSQAGGVAYWAHIGGFVFGFAVVLVYKLLKGGPLWPGGPGGQGEAEYWHG
ncbi:MAG: rhomboid family intramembrane serine protease [Dehalococcoidia bacterium]